MTAGQRRLKTVGQYARNVTESLSAPVRNHLLAICHLEVIAGRYHLVK